MTSPARTGVVSIAAGLARATAAAPDWRGWLAGALAREAKERRFLLRIPVAAMGGVALNLVADRNALAAGDPRPGGISVIAGTHSRATAREATEAANTAGGQTAAGSSFPLLVKQRRQIASPVDHGWKRLSLVRRRRE